MLIGSGTFGPCEVPHCGGMILEAELDIMPNGYSEAGIHGWEVKQHSVTALNHPDGGVITCKPLGHSRRPAWVPALFRPYRAWGFDGRALPGAPLFRSLGAHGGLHAAGRAIWDESSKSFPYREQGPRHRLWILSHDARRHGSSRTVCSLDK